MSEQPAVDRVERLLAGTRDRPLVFVTVGSDHHRFDRLVEWVDSWCADRDGDVDCVVQYGTASVPQHTLGVDYVDHRLLERLLDAADVVVVQGGPMSIVEARQHGKLPLVVPRLARLDEVVDDHQVTFCAKLAAEGHIEVYDDGDSLARRLDSALLEPGGLSVEADPAAAARVAGAVARLGRTASQLLRPRDGRRASVLLLGGAGRSGSTLLERMLDQVQGVTALGEVLHLWERGLAADELCGCGLTFSECPFWTAVGDRAFGGWDSLDAADLVQLRHDVVRTRNAPSLLGLPTSPRRRLQRNRLARLSSRLYAAARDVSGSPLLVDSSKHQAYALLLRRVQVELRCVLVVRDPRAVAHSWRRTVRRPEIVDREETMPRYGLAYTALTWSLSAVVYEGLRALGVPVLVTRYEDLVARPEAELRRVLAFAGGIAADVALPVDGDQVRLEASHTVAGNPMRFTTGTLALRRDDEWQQGLSASEQRRVARLTVPLRRRYGYR